MEINTGDLAFSPAAQRNTAPILEVLSGIFQDGDRVLEVGSGTGQHAVAIASHFPGIHWQPSDRAVQLPDLAARIRHANADNLSPPLALDVADLPWSVPRFDAIFTANTLHIMPWVLGKKLLSSLPDLLLPGGRFIVYGPFLDAAVDTAESNLRFDAQLKSQDPQMGLRSLDKLQAITQNGGLSLQEDHQMPANNRLLVFASSGATTQSDGPI